MSTTPNIGASTAGSEWHGFAMITVAPKYRRATRRDVRVSWRMCARW
jgi:hypothetical protein